jgi:hypothetical protein
MSRGFPSMTALLGLLAIAGYQNRDKIAEMLRGLGQRTPGGAGQGGIGGLLGQLSSSLGGASAGGILSGGLGELVDRFKRAARAKPRSPGSKRVPTNRARRPSLSSDWPGGAGHPVETNRLGARRAALASVPRTP